MAVIMGDTCVDSAKQLIDSVDLSLVVERLVKTEGWSQREAEQVVAQYRNYLFLRKKYPEDSLPPSQEIDEAWHAHILHTVEYRRFCKRVFAEREDAYLDHHPQAEQGESPEKMAELFDRTQALYHREFGEYIYQVTGKSLIRKMLDKVGEYLYARFPTLTEEGAF